MRLIDADVVMETLGIKSDCVNCDYADEIFFCTKGKDFVDACEAIQDAPTIETKRGEWIDNGDRYFRCSLCGTKDTDTWHWCHGCGARMKGADDES